MHNFLKGFMTEKEEDSVESQASITKQELLEQLEEQVKVYESLPQHEKFSFCVNADLQYFMLLVLNILKKG